MAESLNSTSTPTPAEIERAIRGLERCGYKLLAVQNGDKINGYAILFPDGPSRFSSRTETKWRLCWADIETRSSRSSLALHLVSSHRTQRKIQEREEEIAQMLATTYTEPRQAIA
jgi:hypothetical protein